MLTLCPEVMPPAHTLPFPSAATSDGPAASLAKVSRKDARTIPLGILLALDPHARFAADGMAVRRGQTVREFAAERLRWIERYAPQSTSEDAPATAATVATPSPPPTAPAETGDMLDPIETLLGRLNVDDEPDELIIARVTGVRGVGGVGTRGGGW